MEKLFDRVTLDDMTKLEECFNIKIKIFNMNPSGSVNLIFDSINDNKEVMYLNIFDDHLSYITALRGYQRHASFSRPAKVIHKYRNYYFRDENFGGLKPQNIHKQRFVFM